MHRISIDVTPEQHRRLKALAALQGKSLKDFVLSRTLGAIAPDSDEDRALRELEGWVDARIERADREGPRNRTITQVLGDVIDESERSPDV